MATDQVIVNPEKFAKQFGFEDLRGPFVRRRRKNFGRPGTMCGNCLFGDHDACGGPGCSCVHRLFTALEITRSLVK